MTPYEREVMQMALDALNEVNTDSFHGKWVGYVTKEIEALEAALAQPEKEWVGLTDEERNEIMEQQKGFWISGWEVMCMAAVEKKLKEKNT